MTRIFLAIIIMAFLAFTVAGQLPTKYNSADVEPSTPSQRSGDQGECYERAMKNLLLATNIEDPNQDAYLKAADAYLQLDAHGQLCK